MITENKTLRWLESQNRDMNEIHHSADTGLCNRISYWTLAYFLTEKNNYEYTIYVGESYWPELSELISLPNTKIFNEKKNDSAEIKKSNLKQDSVKLDETFLLECLSKDNFSLNGNHFYSSFSFDFLTKFGDSEAIENKVSSIKLQDSELNDMITNLTKDMIGIHIRRGRGVIYDTEVQTLPEKVQRGYIDYRGLEGAGTADFYIYKFIRDDVYFNIIDSFIKENPNQKFYISHDLPDDIFDYYLEKYPNNLYTKKYFYDFIKDRYKTPIHHVKNVVDLFSLSNTKFVLKHPLSTWSSFAWIYNDRKGCYVTDDIQHILSQYLKISN